MKTKLQEYLEHHQIKQVELAKKSGLTPMAISKSVRKGIYNINTAKKLAKALNCNPLFLIEM